MSYAASLDFGFSQVIEQAFQGQDSTAAGPRSRQVTKGETIYRYGDRVTAVYYVRSGKIDLSRYTVDGRLVTFGTVGAGDVFGDIDIYSDTYSCSASAKQTSQIVAYPVEQVYNRMTDNGDLTQALLDHSHQLVQTLKRRLMLLTIRSAQERTMAYFREQLREQSQDPSRADTQTLQLNKSLKAVAEELNISPEAFYRTLAHLQKVGLIQRNKRTITLL